MSTCYKPTASNHLAACLGSMLYWDNCVVNYTIERKNTQQWTHQYIKSFYQQMTNRAFGQLKSTDDLHILKVDLWNEGVETTRDILGNLLNVEAVGFDFSKTICHLAKNRLKNSNVAQAACQNLPFASEKFDLVLDLSTIDHIPLVYADKVFSEYYRVLKPTGLLALAFWRSNLVTKYFLHGPAEQLYFDKKKVACELENSGFRIVSSYDIGSLLTITESNLWLGPFLFWRLKAVFEEKLYTWVARFEQYFLNVMGGLHVFYARHP